MKTAIMFLLLVISFGCDPCGNEVVESAVSPDRKYEATSFIRDCGATTDFSPQVYLRLKGKPLGKIGNVFVGNHSSQIQIQWLSSTQLVIQSACDVSMIVTNYDGIAIVHVRHK